MGWFHAVWLLFWNNIIKNSFVYKIVRGVYDGIARAWRNSKITNLFRKTHISADAAERSLIGRILKSPFTFLTFLNHKLGAAVDQRIKTSAVIRACACFMNNILALNTRFIGIMIAGVSLGIALGGTAMGQNVGIIPLGLLLFGAVILIPNVNLTAFLNGSVLQRFISSSLGIEPDFDFFDKEMTRSASRLILAAAAGIVAGIIGGAAGSIIIAYALLAGLFLVFTIMAKMEFGILLTVFLAPLMPTMAMAGLALLCLFSLIVKAIRDGLTFRFDGMGLLIVALLVIYLISGITSFVPKESLSVWALYFAFMTFYFVIINTVKSRSQLRKILIVFTLSGLAVCLYGIMQYVFGWNINQAWMDEEMFGDIKMRIYSTLDNPNVLGEYILLVLPICISLIWTSAKKWTKFVYTCIALVIFGALILTFSRGCWIGLCAAAAVFVTFVCGKLWGLVLIAIPFIPAILPESVLNRFTSIGDMKDSSTSYRVYIWMGSLKMIKDFWLSGVGMSVAAFTAVYPFYSFNAVVAPHSHNLFLQMIIESGAAGLVVFLLILFFFYKRICTAHSLTGKGDFIATTVVSLAAAMSGFLIQGMFDNSFYNNRVFFIFWIFIAIATCALNIAKDERGGEPM